MQTKSFTTGNIAKAMLAFAGPYILGMIVQNLYGAVDLLVVGHFATTADVSAVTIGSQIMSMATQLIIGFSTGTTVLVGLFYGADNQRDLSRTAGTAILLFTGFALVLTGILLLSYGGIVTLMQTPPEAVSATRSYLLVCILGIVFIVGYNIVNSILMGLGDSRTPFIFICIACVINIVGDIILVRYFHLGALGAGIATTAAQAGSVIFSLLYLRKKGLGFPLAKADIRLDKKLCARILKVGGPVAVQNILVGASFLFITAIINVMGVVASAAVGVVEKLINFFLMPASSFGAAVATVSAQNLGAGEPARARQSMWHGVWMSLIPSVLITIFCQFGGGFFARLFTTDTAVIAMAADYLRSYVVDAIMVSFVFCMNGYFNGMGRSWFTLLHSLLTTFALRVPLSYLFSRLGTGLYVIGWAAPLSSLASIALCVVYLLILRRKKTA